MPIMLVFDYLKGFFFKLQNENEEHKHQMEKQEKEGNLNDFVYRSKSQYSQDNEQYVRELKTNLEKHQFENGKLKMELDKTVKELIEYKT